MKVLSLLIFCGMLSACNIEAEDLVETYNYQYAEAFCETGSHSFNTLSAYCSALQNDTLNNNCARSQRQDAFYNRCSGSF